MPADTIQNDPRGHAFPITRWEENSVEMEGDHLA